MKRLRSLSLCGSGGDQTTWQLNEGAHMYADRSIENSRSFQSTLWEYLGQRLWRYNVSEGIFAAAASRLSSTVYMLEQPSLTFSLQVCPTRKLNKSSFPLLQCYASVKSFLIAQRLSCTSSVLRQYIGKIGKQFYSFFFLLL